MQFKLFQIDAFTDKPFRGNPAAVCPLNTWLDPSLMQQIAAENNLSETAFFVRVGDHYDLRWFTPRVEVDLCGHATLASAYVLVNELGEKMDPIVFRTRSGDLFVHRNGPRLTLDFPSQPPSPCTVPPSLLPALGLASAEVQASVDYFVIVESEALVRSLTPDFSGLRGLPNRGVIVTAPGESCDFVSRWFGPSVGVDEDPVTGSAHCALTPYWAVRLKRTNLEAEQVSERGGRLSCELKGDRVLLTGSAVKYLEGTIDIGGQG